MALDGLHWTLRVAKQKSAPQEENSSGWPTDDDADEADAADDEFVVLACRSPFEL